MSNIITGSFTIESDRPAEELRNKFYLTLKDNSSDVLSLSIREDRYYENLLKKWVKIDLEDDEYCLPFASLFNEIAFRLDDGNKDNDVVKKMNEIKDFVTEYLNEYIEREDNLIYNEILSIATYDMIYDDPTIETIFRLIYEYKLEICDEYDVSNIAEQDTAPFLHITLNFLKELTKDDYK